MTPPAAAPAPVRVRRAPARRPPRRVSGPAGGARAGRAVAAGGAVVLPLPVRAAEAARRLPDAPLIDRLVRGRLWIAFVAVALMGIVFLQVSLLGLNATISRSVATAEALQRENSVLRADVTRLAGTERVQLTAARLGMTTPPAGSVAFVDASADPARAAKRITAPDPLRWQEGLAADQQAAGLVTPAAEAVATATTAVQAAPVAGEPPAAETTAPAATTPPAATTTAPPAQGTTAPPAPQGATAAAGAAQTAAAPAPAGGTAAPEG